MAKFTYNVIVNDIDLNDYHKFRYTYSRMEMQIMVSKDSFIVVYETNTQKTYAAVWNSREVEDAVRKSLLVQLIFYGHNVDIKKVLVKESHSSDTQIITDPRIYNLIPSDELVDLSALRNDTFVGEYLVKRVKSSYASGVSALFSYIYAKSKRTEEDRFTYFWRSFNGIYVSIAQEDVANKQVDASNVKSENAVLKNWLKNREAQTFMVSSLFTKYYADQGNYQEAEKKIRHFFYTIRDLAAKAKWTKADVKTTLGLPGNKNVNLANLLGLSSYIPKKKPDCLLVEIDGKQMFSKSTLYGYLMTELAYHIRCEYFHAAKPILLHTTLSNPEFRALELANALLEHYLDEHIREEVMKKIDLDRRGV